MHSLPVTRAPAGVRATGLAVPIETMSVSTTDSLLCTFAHTILMISEAPLKRRSLSIRLHRRQLSWQSS